MLDGPGQEGGKAVPETVSQYLTEDGVASAADGANNSFVSIAGALLH